MAFDSTADRALMLGEFCGDAGEISVTPSDTGETTGYMTVKNAGVAVQGVTVSVQILKLANGTTGIGIEDPLTSGTTDVNGYVEFTGLPRLATYQTRVGAGSKWYRGTTADADTTPLVGALGVAE